VPTLRSRRGERDGVRDAGEKGGRCCYNLVEERGMVSGTRERREGDAGGDRVI
jgi:hypothetical protein